jgi:hypothetical protein
VPDSADPSGLTAVSAGATVRSSWRPPTAVGAIEGYVLEAGSAAGHADLLRLDLGVATTQTVAGVPAGRYVARVTGVNACGAGAPSLPGVVHVP